MKSYEIFQINKITLVLYISFAFVNISKGQSDTTTTLFPHRLVPGRMVPSPAAASLQLQQAESSFHVLNFSTLPKSTEEWTTFIKTFDSSFGNKSAQMAEFYKVHYENELINGVKTYSVIPDTIPEKNKDKVLLHFHAGAYIFLEGEQGLAEAILMAHYSKTRIISVDYRMPPSYPFPAAVDDAVTVYKEILKSYKPVNIGIFGSSCGGGLTAALILKAHELNLQGPGAAALLTPWIDLTKTGDTWFTNDGIDNVLNYDGLLKAAAKLYAGNYDLKYPLISPLYGDLKFFPPTTIVAGTRDVILSDAVRTHLKLRHSGIECDLNVFEGMSHAAFLFNPEIEECKDVFKEVSSFLDKHLGAIKDSRN
jgi:monoterpene epsilon-lactone hydrolase